MTGDLKAGRQQVPERAADVLVDELVDKLAKSSRELRKICRDRLEYPGDMERFDDLLREVVHAHSVLSAIASRFGSGLNHRD